MALLDLFMPVTMLEGELIGYNILQFACDNKYEVSKRAKFSSLTDSELTKSFRNLQLTNIRNANEEKLDI